MNIVYTTSAKVPSRAANAVQSLKMCDAFARLGHGVRLHCRKGDDGDVFASYGLTARFTFEPMAVRGPPGLRTLAFEHDVRRASRRRPLPDLYFSRDVYALLAVATTGVPMILEVHRTMEGASVEQLALSWLLTQPSFRGVVVVSRAMGRWYQSVFSELDPIVEPGAAEEVAVVEGVAPPLRRGALQVGYVGHLYPGRGIEVIAELANRMPDVDVHVVGGDDADVARCRNDHALPNLTFHGFVRHVELPRLTRSFDVLLAPYQDKVYVKGGAETAGVMSPLKLFEYMALGLPIVCSDLPVLREVLDDDVAMLVPAAGVNGWSEAVAHLRDNPMVRARLGQQALARFRARHTWTSRASRILEVLA